MSEPNHYTTKLYSEKLLAADIANNVKVRFNTSNYKLGRPLPKTKSQEKVRVKKKT